MTLIIHQNVAGETLRTVTLDRRRRRLSTVLRAQMPRRPAIVAVRRKGYDPTDTDDTIKLRNEWASTLVAAHDIVVITYLPLGGANKNGGGGGKAIGAAVAALALAIVAPYAAGFLATSVFGLTGMAATVVKSVISLAIIAGASYMMSKATKAKANKTDDRPLYGVSGGGNLPRPGDRIPVNYGRVWVQPDLSQPDYSYYDGDDMVVMKRMTLGAGKYRVHRIRVGQATMWSETEGLQAPFLGAELEFIVPGENSRLVPSSVFSSENVAGSELPRPTDNPMWMGPFPVCPVGTSTASIQLDYTCPQCYATFPKKAQQQPGVWQALFEYAAIDDDGRVVGPWMTLNNDVRNYQRFTRAQRVTRVIPVPAGRYAVRARNPIAEWSEEQQAEGYNLYNTVTWDGLRGYLQHEPVRPYVTEIAMKIRSGKGLGSTTSFSDIWIETTSVLPVWNGVAWTEQPERRAVWVAADILRNNVYGGALPDTNIDIERLRHYSDTLIEYDTFDGSIRGPISVVEAASTALGVIRAEPLRIGSMWSMARDEPRQIRKHMITRRQIIKESSGVDYDFDISDGSSDVIVEYLVDGDPRKKGEWRETIGPMTSTPKRINAFGVSTHGHAVHLGRWYAAAAYYRRESRVLSTEMSGRIMARNDPASIEMWFLDNTQTAGVETRSDYSLMLDADIDYPAGAHAVFRTPSGMDWGPVAIDEADGRRIALNASDIAVIEMSTGESFSSLFAKDDKRLPVTVRIGTVTTVMRPYIIRGAKADADGRVQVTSVYDAPEVWETLGEAVPLPPPIGEIIDREGDLLPVLPWIKGAVVQKATAAVLDWSVCPARGCQQYRIDISYNEGLDYECISDGPMTEGSYAVPYWEGAGIRLRGVAINGHGIPSVPVYAVADMLKPLIDDSIANLQIKYENAVDQFRKELDQIRDVASGSLHAELDNLRRDIEQLAADAALEGVTAYERDEVFAVKFENRFAAAATRLKLLASADDVLAQRIDSLIAKVDGDITAAIVEERTARINADGVLARSISTVSTTVGEHSASISQVSESVDGIKVQYSVVGTIDQSTGGFVLSGARQMNGTVTWNMKLRGDLLVDGSISAAKLWVSELSAISGNFGNMYAGNIYLNGGKLAILNAGRIEVYD